MKLSSKRLERDSSIELSMTSMIDVVFLLLIFFLVSSRFSEEERELDLNLPSVTEALPASAQLDELVVNIDAEGRYFIRAFGPRSECSKTAGPGLFGTSPTWRAASAAGSRTFVSRLNSRS